MLLLYTKLTFKCNNWFIGNTIPFTEDGIWCWDWWQWGFLPGKQTSIIVRNIPRQDNHAFYWHCVPCNWWCVCKAGPLNGGNASQKDNKTKYIHSVQSHANRRKVAKISKWVRVKCIFQQVEVFRELVENLIMKCRKWIKGFASSSKSSWQESGFIKKMKWIRDAFKKKVHMEGHCPN